MRHPYVFECLPELAGWYVQRLSRACDILSAQCKSKERPKEQPEESHSTVSHHTVPQAFRNAGAQTVGATRISYHREAEMEGSRDSEEENTKTTIAVYQSRARIEVV